MAMFVHLAPRSRVALIRRNGISRLRQAWGDRPAGIFAVPVTRKQPLLGMERALVEPDPAWVDDQWVLPMDQPTNPDVAIWRKLWPGGDLRRIAEHELARPKKILARDALVAAVGYGRIDR